MVALIGFRGDGRSRYDQARTFALKSALWSRKSGHHPGTHHEPFDISAIDPATGRYYLSDRSNRAIDIFDTTKDTYVGRVGSFVGAVMKDGKVASDVSGPDGVAVVGSEIWAGDGDSTVKVIDPVLGKTIATLPSGGKTRVDEMAYDPKDQAFISVNNAEDPPFATVTSTKPDHALIGKVVFPDAGDGAEQPAYNPQDGMFYMSIPQIGKDPKKGAVAVIDPKAGKLVKMLPVDGCHPAGLAFGPDENFVLGCDADGTEMPAQIVVMNAKSGAVVATVPGIGGPIWSTTTRATVNITQHHGVIRAVRLWV